MPGKLEQLHFRNGHARAQVMLYACLTFADTSFIKMDITKLSACKHLVDTSSWQLHSF